MTAQPYNEILEMIMRRLKLRLMTGEMNIYSDNLSFPTEENDEVSSPIVPVVPGKAKSIKAFDDYDYHLDYNASDELDKFSSHDGNLNYTLNKDSFGDLTTISVKSPGLEFKVALIYENYDIRKNDPETAKKGKLTDVVLVNTDNSPFSIGIKVTPPLITVYEGESAQYTATLTNADGSTEDVTNQCVWSSSDPKYTVTNGLVSNCAAGTSKITAKLDYDTDSAQLNVLSYTIVVEPENTILEIKNGVAQVVPMKAYKLASNGSKSDITSDPNCSWIHGNNSWASNFTTNPITISVNSAGQDGVVASYKGKFGTGTINATEITESLRVEPDDITVNLNAPANFQAIYTINGVDRNVTNDCYWYLGNQLMPWEINKGYVTGTSVAGSSPISAKYKGLENAGNLTVQQPPPPERPKLVIEPASQTVNWKDYAFYEAYLIDGGQKTNVTTRCDWKTSPGGNLFDPNGLHGVADTKWVDYVVGGQIVLQVTATDLNNLVATAELIIGEVPPPPDTSKLVITPSEVDCKIGDTPQFTATYMDASGNSDVTNTCDWTIDHFNIDSGLVTGINDDNDIVAIVTASFEGKTATAKVLVRKPAAKSLTIIPSTKTVQIGQTFKFTSKYIKNNIDLGSIADVGVWTIDKYSISQGYVTNINDSGVATITLTYDGVTAQATLTVTKQLSSPVLEVVPATKDMINGETYQFKAYYTSPEGVRTEVTSSTSWDTAGYSPISSTGLLTAVTPGGTVIATYNGLTARASVYVKNSSASLRISPSYTNVTPGQTYPMTAIYTDLDGHDTVVTSQASWSISKFSINNTVNKGLIYDIFSSGTAIVTATYQGLSATAEVYSGIEVHNTDIEVKVWDDGVFDYDTINIWLNGDLIRENLVITTNGVIIPMTLHSGDNSVVFEGVRSDSGDVTSALQVMVNDVVVASAQLHIRIYYAGWQAKPYPKSTWNFKVV